MERIAHRGAKREFPENTLQAFQRAFELGADGVELDVHATKDGIVVVHHDPIVRRGPDDGLDIAHAAWTELETIDLGSGIGIPSLSAVLAIAAPNSTVYVELKGAGIEERVARVIAESPTRCAAHSFDHAMIGRMRSIAPNIPRGILFENATADALRVMDAVGARDVWPHWKLIEQPLVDAVHAAGGRVIAWTVNDESVAKRLAEMGVDGVCGDDVRLFV